MAKLHFLDSGYNPKYRPLSGSRDSYMEPKFTAPRLPEEVIQHILEQAARSDKRTALRIASLSRRVHRWLDAILYAEVHLMSQDTARLFLRTVQQRVGIHITTDSRVQQRNGAYFGLLVRSAYLCANLDPRTVVSILAACDGIQDLTYWPEPSRSFITVASSPWDIPSPGPYIRQSLSLVDRREASHSPFNISLNQFGVETLPHLSPRKLSLLLQADHSITLFRLNHPETTFFSHVTHLSIANRWEEWVYWARVFVKEEALPSLEYLKFDLLVGAAPPDQRGTPGIKHGSTGSTSAWLQTVTGTYLNSGKPWNVGFTDYEESNVRWDDFESKMEKVAIALSTALNNHALLKVCVLVLRCDSDAARTARCVSRLASSKFRVPATPNKKGFDPRLVFAWEKEPFRYPYAHSLHERMIWKSAEAVAKVQRHLGGYTVLDCDRLI